LLLLHTALDWVPEADLLKSIEYSNGTVYRSKVLVTLHKQRMIEYDRAAKRAKISPTGGRYVEKEIIEPTISAR
jgi:hypothetical protein